MGVASLRRDAIANLQRVVVVAGPEDSRILQRSPPEICASAGDGATCNQALLAGSDTKKLHPLQDAGVARLARTVQGQLPLFTNVPPDRLRQAIVRAISSALDTAPTAIDVGVPLQDGRVEPAQVLPQAPAPSPSPVSATVSATAQPVSSPSVPETRTTVVQQPAQRYPPPVPATAITSPRASPPSSSAATTPPPSFAPAVLATPSDKASNNGPQQAE
eukprot:COSAG02_NODE_24509_length_686_cov_0.850085_1_plen_217_part_10